jgi:sulfate-transporting ATPase
MGELLQYLILGLGLGAAYALTAQGLVVIHRGSGVVNFANAAIGFVGAYVEYELHEAGVPTAISVAVGVAAAGLLGLVAHWGVMRRLWSAAQLTRVIATLGMLNLISGLAVVKLGDSQLVPPHFLTNRGVQVAGHSVSSYDLWLIAIAVVLTAGLHVVYHHTRFGALTAATSENRRAASALGHSPDFVAGANWAIGSMLAAVAAILIAPTLSLSVTSIGLMLVPALAAAVLGDFTSFRLALVGAFLIGIGESMVQWADIGQGWPDAVPFVAVILILLLKGSALPGRSVMQQRLPKVGDGSLNWKVAGPAIVAAVALTAFVSAGFIGAMYITAASAIIILSSVVVTGYAGQLSLAQLALAGAGAYIGSRVAQSAGLGFWPALAVAVVGILPIGLIAGIPALRTRGVNLAIVTLGIGVIVNEVVLANPDYTGGYGGTMVEPPTLFGLDFDATYHPARYFLLCLAFLVACAVAVSNLRRGSVGRYLVAVRGNERAAASLGLNVARLKLYAFAVSAVLATVGGMLLIYQAPFVTWSTGWDVVTGIALLGGLVMTGLGYTSAAVAAGFAATGAVLPYLFGLLGADANKAIAPILGLGMIVAVIQTPDGVIPTILRDHAAKRDRKRAGKGHATQPTRSPGPPAQVTPRSGHRLELSGLSVSFGGVKALTDVSFSVASGEIVALIGPNGAGKTTLIDVVTGMTRPDAGAVQLDGDEVSRRSAARRARLGLARSFQALELFDDLTVRENLLVAAERNRWWHYLQALAFPGRGALSSAALAAVHAFGLADDLDRRPGELPYGRRRLVGIARAVSGGASIVLLDEPAAGLDERESAELAGLLRMLADDWGLGVLLVEHDVKLVTGVSDRIAALDFGRLLRCGTPDEVLHDPAVVTAYLGERPGARETVEAKR